jgi:serine/threonine-protein kinase
MDVYGPRTQRMGADTMLAAGATSSIPPVDYDDYDDRYAPARRGGGRRWIPWVLGLVLVLGVVGGVAYYLLGSSKTYFVPQVDGLTQAQAVQQLQQNHLQAAIIDQPSSSVQKGIVIRSSPSQGSSVAQNSTVTLIVSSGAANISVPGVVGQQETTAVQTLENDGLQVKTVTDPTSTAPQGQVTNQNPVKGVSVPPGSTVTITVSGGEVTVPGVINKTQQQAESDLQNAGFQPQVQNQACSANFANGTVCSQTPNGNTMAAKGTTVTIVVQNGAPSPSPSVSPTPSNNNSGSPAPF